MFLGARVRAYWSDRRWRRRWLLGLGALVLSMVPLVGTLGYFSGLIFAPVFSLVAVGVGVDTVRSVREENRSAGVSPTRSETLARLSSLGVGEIGVLLAVVLGVLGLGMLWNRNCDPWAGLVFFGIGPGASASLGLVCGWWGGVLAQARRHQLALGALPFFASLGVAVWRLYFDPVVYAYDPFWGWFAGGIYDESVAVGRRYLSYRAYNLAAAGAALLAFRGLVGGVAVRTSGWPPGAGDRIRLALAAALGLGAGWVGLHGDERGFTATLHSIDRQLPLARETEHFVIHYAPRSPAAREIEMIAAEHEFAWHQLARTLGREPAAPVHSFVFRDPDHKRASFGAGQVEVSLPWKGQIYLHHLPFPHEVMPHELAHTFGGAFGDPLLGISRSGLNINMGLVEGLANALAPRESFGLDLHDQAAVLDRLEKRPPLTEIMGVGFWRRASSQAYTAAGSFVRWLIDTQGVEPVVEVYRSGGDFDAAFGRPLEDLEAQWVEFLRARELREDDVETMRQRFSQRSIFRRPCAHRVDGLRKQAARAKAQGDRDELIESMQTLCTIEPEHAEHRIALATAHAELSELEAAMAELDRAESMEEMTHQLLAVIHERRGDVALLAGDWSTAEHAFATAMTYGLGEAQLRSLQIKRAAAADPAAAPEILDYFQPLDPDDKGTAAAIQRMYAAVRLRDRPGWKRVGAYLVGRQLLNFAQPELAVEPLVEALAPDSREPALPSPQLLRAARLALVNALVQTRAWEPASGVLDQIEAEPGLRSGHALEIELWRERIAFFEGWFAA